MRANYTVFISLLLLLFPSCEKEKVIDFKPLPVSGFSHQIVTDYFKLQLKLTKESLGVSPPVAARNFGYVGLALYQSLLPGMSDYNSMGGQLNGILNTPTPSPALDYYWPAVANGVMESMVHSLFPQAASVNKDAIDALFNSYMDTFLKEVPAEIINASTEYGRSVAIAVVQYAESDGGHDGYKPDLPFAYVPPVGVGLWVPTIDNGFKPALKPFWGNNRSFIPDIVENTQPTVPVAPYSTDPHSEFMNLTTEVFAAVNEISLEQSIIANYWSDDPIRTATPPGHSISILTNLIIEENENLEFSVYAYAKLGIALNDAFISCWRTKYDVNYIRPITVIRNNLDPAWEGILITPPFPEYTSGHSVQSGATAEILEDLYGDNYAFIDYTHKNRTDIVGTPRTFNSFEEFSNEAALSRIYGGIHFRPAVEIGLEQGREVGKIVNQLNWKK